MDIDTKNFREYRSYAVVTGAASGMGRLYARRLALSGYSLIVIDINGQKLEETADAIRAEVAGLSDWRIPYKSSFRVLTLVQDLSQQDAAARVAGFSRQNGCDVEVLVNNAGLFYYQGIAETSPRALSRMVMVHDYTPLMLCREFVPQMKERGCGYVLNVSSLAAWIPWPGLGMYASTKRFVKDFSRALRVECRGTGVSVTNAYFGAVDTPLFNLKPSYRRLARNLRIMIPAEKAVEKALRAMFRRRKGIMPGVLNHIFKPVVTILPDPVLAWIYRLLEPIRMDV
ncbi:MAG: SDR family NAD(P)-dependent oxidoreductase [Bacteroidetes bacterium]|uniref:SDR family NAD(P)-dependent oxidoreductase n=1 Tax=Candidatus Cryptobacteroides excrementipullorum TaxID=2840761 RepID=A0A9D9IRB2_9BACT|nr:SDR family NAD(P)-dependent oxidoreductase [Candidatus Cryptobacteroides excrementipullorum]